MLTKALVITLRGEAIGCDPVVTRYMEIVGDHSDEFPIHYVEIVGDVNIDEEDTWGAIEIVGDTNADTWSATCSFVKIACHKLTHQPRRQAQQVLDWQAIPQHLIERFAGYSAENKDNVSYITNHQVGVMAALAGSPHAGSFV
jgi:hypothetical protein